MTNTAQGASAPVVFFFESRKIRVIASRAVLWFAAADVCAAMGVPNTTKALARLDDDDRAVYSIQGSQINIVNESGLYRLILASRKPEAKRFKQWVMAEVVPAKLPSPSEYMLVPAVEYKALVEFVQARKAEALAWGRLPAVLESVFCSAQPLACKGA